MSKLQKKIISIDDPFFGSGPEKLIEERENLVKQFLTFSDNRQAAAFFDISTNNIPGKFD